MGVLVLCLDKRERGEGEMRGLVGGLGFAGGVVLRPPVSVGRRVGAGMHVGGGRGGVREGGGVEGALGGCEWDSDRWGLVAIEL